MAHGHFVGFIMSRLDYWHTFIVGDMQYKSEKQVKGRAGGL